MTQTHTLKTNRVFIILFLMLFVGFTSCAPTKVERGEASYYHNKFRGKKTASGQKFRQYKLTAAHKTLPLGTKVKVTNLQNGKTVRVTINDRGPFVDGRIIDLTRRAARRIDMLKDGVAPVKIEYKVKKR